VYDVTEASGEPTISVLLPLACRVDVEIIRPVTVLVLLNAVKMLVTVDVGSRLSH